VKSWPELIAWKLVEDRELPRKWGILVLQAERLRQPLRRDFAAFIADARSPLNPKQNLLDRIVLFYEVFGLTPLAAGP